MLVGVDQKDIVPVAGQPGGDIHCQRGFADTTLLIEKEIITKSHYHVLVNVLTHKNPKESQRPRIAQRNTPQGSGFIWLDII